MNYDKLLDFSESKEVFTLDDILSEDIETKTKPGQLAAGKADDDNGRNCDEAGGGCPANDIETKNDPRMERIKAFIRKIDINSL